MKAHDLHTHTVYCDGSNTPEQMIQKAIEKGLSTIGVLTHSYVEFEESSLSYEKARAFQEECNRLKEKYKGKIKVLCGVEEDYFSVKEKMIKGFDYVIGSVHYFTDKYNRAHPIDIGKSNFCLAVKELFDGDYYKAMDNYFEKIYQVVDRTGADIIGHLDVIRKYNANCNLFDDTHPRYIEGCIKAVDKLLPYDVPFEINVGAMFRTAKQTEPYPKPIVIEYIKSKGGTFVYGTDSHKRETVGKDFEKWSHFLTDKFKGELL